MPSLNWKSRLIALAEIIVIAGPVLTLLWWAGLKAIGAVGQTTGIREMSLIALPHSAIVLIAMIMVSLWRREPMADFLWKSSTKADVGIGLGLVPLCFAIDFGGRFLTRTSLPTHYGGTHNTMLDGMASPLDFGLFVAIGLIAGGFREELLRSYVIHRFGQFFNSRLMGVIIFGVWFSLGHLDLQDLSSQFIQVRLGLQPA